MRHHSQEFLKYTILSLLHLSDETGQMQLVGVTYDLKERTYSSISDSSSASAPI
jgi:hypothetical protein